MYSISLSWIKIWVYSVLCMHFRCTLIKEILESIYKNSISLLLHLGWEEREEKHFNFCKKKTTTDILIFDVNKIIDQPLRMLKIACLPMRNNYLPNVIFSQCMKSSVLKLTHNNHSRPSYSIDYNVSQPKEIMIILSSFWTVVFCPEAMVQMI